MPYTWSYIYTCVSSRKMLNSKTHRHQNNDNLTQDNSHLLLNSTYLLLTPSCFFSAADLLLWTSLVPLLPTVLPHSMHSTQSLWMLSPKFLIFWKYIHTLLLFFFFPTPDVVDVLHLLLTLHYVSSTSTSDSVHDTIFN